MVLRVFFKKGLASVSLLSALLVPACPASAFAAAPFGSDPRSGWLAGGGRGVATRPSLLCPQLFCPGLLNCKAPLVMMTVRGGSSLPPDVVERNERRTGERKEQNLEIARRVAAGEVRAWAQPDTLTQMWISVLRISEPNLVGIWPEDPSVACNAWASTDSLWGCSNRCTKLKLYLCMLVNLVIHDSG